MKRCPKHNWKPLFDLSATGYGVDPLQQKGRLYTFEQWHGPDDFYSWDRYQICEHCHVIGVQFLKAIKPARFAPYRIEQLTRYAETWKAMQAEAAALP